MNSSCKFVFIALALSTIAFGNVSMAQTVNCLAEAQESAVHFAQNNNDFFGCVAVNATDNGAEGIAVELVCAADTGSHNVTVTVNYANPETCSDPSLTQTSIN